MSAATLLYMSDDEDSAPLAVIYHIPPNLGLFAAHPDYRKGLERLLECGEGIEYPVRTPLAKFNGHPSEGAPYLEKVARLYNAKFGLYWKKRVMHMDADNLAGVRSMALVAMRSLLRNIADGLKDDDRRENRDLAAQIAAFLAAPVAEASL